MIAGLVIGLMGSLHCLGMCGPLVLSMPFGQGKGLSAIFKNLIYHSGRLFSYGLLGITAGILGAGLNLLVYQKYVSIIAGVLMLCWVVMKYTPLGKNATAGSAFYLFLTKKFGKYTRSSKPSALLSMGMLNGFLPCGLVYLAAISSISMASPIKGFIFMVLFGAGTIPVLLGAVISRLFVGRHLKFNPQRLIPALATFIAILFILRGLSLGIPYLSPDIRITENQKVESCCVKSFEE